MEEVFIAKLVDFVVDPVKQFLIALLHCGSDGVLIAQFGDTDLEALVGLGPCEHLGVVGGEGVATAVEQRVVGIGVLVVLLQLDKKELEMAKMLVQTMAKPFVAAEFRDEYQERLRNAIMQKIKGNDVLMVEQGAANNVIDLMEALKGSLDMMKQEEPVNREGKIS